MKTALSALALTLAATSCDQTQEHTCIPRRTAYPRPQIYDTVYAATAHAPIHFEVNTSATVAPAPSSGTKSVWIDISYPAYDATIFCTFTPVTNATISSAISNRKQRIALNIEGHRSESCNIESPDGFISTVILSPSARSTPLQFISTDRREWVVSGTLFFHNAQKITATDSIAPIVEAVHRDMTHTLTTIAHGKD